MQMCGAHALDRLAHVSSTASASMDNFDQVACDRNHRIVLEDDEMPALLQAAVAIANGHLPVTRHLVKIVHSTPTRCC